MAKPYETRRRYTGIAARFARALPDRPLLTTTASHGRSDIAAYEIVFDPTQQTAIHGAIRALATAVRDSGLKGYVCTRPPKRSVECVCVRRGPVTLVEQWDMACMGMSVSCHVAVIRG